MAGWQISLGVHSKHKSCVIMRNVQDYVLPSRAAFESVLLFPAPPSQLKGLHSLDLQSAHQNMGYCEKAVYCGCLRLLLSLLIAAHFEGQLQLCYHVSQHIRKQPHQRSVRTSNIAHPQDATTHRRPTQPPRPDGARHLDSHRHQRASYHQQGIPRPPFHLLRPSRR